MNVFGLQEEATKPGEAAESVWCPAHVFLSCEGEMCQTKQSQETLTTQRIRDSQSLEDKSWLNGQSVWAQSTQLRRSSGETSDQCQNNYELDYQAENAS